LDRPVIGATGSPENSVIDGASDSIMEQARLTAGIRSQRKPKKSDRIEEAVLLLEPRKTAE
jgi:hypothetical protein